MSRVLGRPTFYTGVEVRGQHLSSLSSSTSVGVGPTLGWVDRHDKKVAVVELQSVSGRQSVGGNDVGNIGK